MTKPATPAANPRPSNARPLIVMGYDENQKPRGARFTDAAANLVTKAAQAMDLNVYEAKTRRPRRPGQEAAGRAAVFQRQRVRAEHPAKPVQPDSCCAGA